MKYPQRTLLLLLSAATLYGLTIAAIRAPKDLPVPMRLSEYGFFDGDIAWQAPAPGVTPYTLNTPLFSDFAEKLRFVRVPDGKKVPYNDSAVLDFPVGTIIMKTFYYPEDARDPERGRQLMETRVLVHEAEGWSAWPYIWNEEQTEAYLEVAGGTTKVEWRNQRGRKQKLDYSIPNKNQCNGCHVRHGKFTPIGPSVRQLNGRYPAVGGNQLVHWRQEGFLTGGPPNITQAPRVPEWANADDGTLNERARAWLDINCAHCHQPGGPAETSALNLNLAETDPQALGVYKKPIAAGRGSGGLTYSIVPGKPKESILLHRLNSDDPGVMMPELGRQLIYPEAVDLITEWIKEMPEPGE